MLLYIQQIMYVFSGIEFLKRSLIQIFVSVDIECIDMYNQIAYIFVHNCKLPVTSFRLHHNSIFLVCHYPGYTFSVLRGAVLPVCGVTAGWYHRHRIQRTGKKILTASGYILILVFSKYLERSNVIQIQLTQLLWNKCM